ncbi:PH domain-containing protein [Knoellia subterranea]|uniref:Membrane protein n=1 Tax=Knoellia subterranea KCTC 19937 TaxID=1385521 RepID=A0A0A0JTN3_9MICO|nr:PH domain-containing protein [Knoellia subterranea]KGN39001.1 membrane protein [Knoellia subterranea KCTC 19937]
MTTSPESAAVSLRGNELPWRSVSPSLRTVRLITLFGWLVPFVIAFVALAVLVTPWFWIGAGAVAVLIGWGAWLIVRQVSAITWIELDEEIVIRKGRLFRSLVSIPYGRLQYIDVESGPLMRSRGIASCEFHTASPESGGTLPGLPVDEAEALRGRLAARGEAQRAGL